MELLQTVTLDCPYCGETVGLLVDCSAGSQDYVEDCPVCCRPIAVAVRVADGELIDIDGRAEDA